MSLERRYVDGEGWKTVPVDGGSLPIVQSGPPDQGVNAYYFAGGTPAGSFTFTIDGEETTSLAADADTTTMADALSVAATGATGSVIPYPGDEDSTLADGTYFLFVRSLGARPIDPFTCSDGAVTIGGDDRAGVLPDPVGEAGQTLFDETTPALYEYAPAANDEQASAVWQLIWPPVALTATSGDLTATVSVVDGQVQILLSKDGDNLVTLGMNESGGKGSLTMFCYDPDTSEAIGEIVVNSSGLDLDVYGVGGPSGNDRTTFGVQHDGITHTDATLVFKTLIGTVDPSAGAGLVAGIGASYRRSDGTLWQKTGAGDTAWEQLAFVP